MVYTGGMEAQEGSTPEYLVAAYRPLHDWLHRLYSLGHAHGSRLAEDLAAVVMANCRVSDDLLDTLTDAGWILRDDKPSPTRDQVFFGWGGRPPGKRSRSMGSASEYGYRPGPDLLRLLQQPPDPV